MVFRRLAVCGVALAGLLGCVSSASAETLSAAFQNPPLNDRPEYRMWNGGGAMDGHRLLEPELLRAGPGLKTAMMASGGSLFFDSLELNRSGAQVGHWTPDFLSEFKARRGYSLVPYFPVVSTAIPLASAFTFPTTGSLGNLAAQVNEDYNQTLSDLFRDGHLRPAQAWAHSLNMTLRGQAYSSWGPSPLDSMELYGEQDIAEGEEWFTRPRGSIIGAEGGVPGNFPRRQVCRHTPQQRRVGVIERVRRPRQAR